MSEENKKVSNKDKPGNKSVKIDYSKDERFKRGGRKPAYLKYKIDDVDKRIIQHLLEYPDTTQKDLANQFGYSVSGIINRIKRPAFVNAMKDMHLKTMDIYLSAQTLAARRLMKLIQSSDEQVALKACNLALHPLVNQATLNVNASVEKIYRVRFGEQGQMFQEVLDIEAEPEVKTTTLDILRTAGVAE